MPESDELEVDVDESGYSDGIWVLCPECEDFWCSKHKKHVYDCECPTIEWFAEKGIDPYEC